MGNVLQKDKQQQIVALGRLQWPLRRIEEATGVRRETISAYLKAAGIAVRGRGRPSERPAKPAISPPAVSTDPPSSAAVESPPERAPSASACEPYRTFIEEALGRGRNAMAVWQDLVDDHGFTARYASVKRFVAVLRTQTSPDARVVILTAPGEDYGEPDVMVSTAENGRRRLPAPVSAAGSRFP
jgi:transposase